MPDARLWLLLTVDGVAQVALALSAEGAAEVALPEGVYDVNGQQLDTRRENSWLLKLGEVATVEAAEVLAINTLAPFTLNSKLKPLMLAAEAEGEPKFVVNVSAMEGKFYRFKTANHPHTNMAKAALNMMTRTAAHALKDEKIYMNSVDTGWCVQQAVSRRRLQLRDTDEIDLLSGSTMRIRWRRRPRLRTMVSRRLSTRSMRRRGSSTRSWWD